MDPNQPSSVEGDTLFRAMENMLRRYAQRLEAGQSTWDTEDAPGPNGLVTRNDAIAAAYQLAGYIAATPDPRVVPDPRRSRCTSRDHDRVHRASARRGNGPSGVGRFFDRSLPIISLGPLLYE